MRLATRHDDNIEFYRNNASIGAFTSSGLNVVGTIFGDALDISQNGATTVTLGQQSSGDSTTLYFGKGFDQESAIWFNGSANYGGLVMLSNENIVISLDEDNVMSNDKSFSIQGSGRTKTHFSVEETGDISFYEDTGSTPKMVWKASDERLGIGNAAPATALDVTGTVTAQGLTVDTDTLHVDATNNRVGVGTTSPSNELHVSNRADFMIDVDGDDAAAIFKEVGGDAWRIGYRSVQDQFRIAFDEASLGTNVRVAMTTSGNLGLGTTSPSQKLDVSGNIAVSGTVDGVDIATNIPSSLGAAGQVLTVNAGATAGEWADVSASAEDGIFWENDQAVTSNYTITNNKNAMSAGPITINSGVTVTVGDGEAWTVV